MAASARLRSVMSSMASRINSGSLLSGGNLRALSSMFLCPIGEVVFDLEVFDGMAVAQDLSQQRPKLGNVPLAVAQVVDEAALRLFFRDMEVPVEGGVGRADPQALVEDHEWLSQGRNDVLGVGKGVLQFMRMLITIRFHSVLVLHLLFLGIVATKSRPQRPKKSRRGGTPEGIRPRRLTRQRASRLAGLPFI